MISLKDDIFYTYAGYPTLLNILGNDTVPESFFLNENSSVATTSGNNLLVTLDTDRFLASTSFEYSVTDADTGESQTATVFVGELSGTPGLGGFYITGFGTVSEDDGVFEIDLGALIDPQNPTGHNIEVDPVIDLSAFHDFDINGTLDGNIFSIDLDQFSRLDEGQTSGVIVTFYTTVGGQRTQSNLSFDVTGAADASSTISSVASNGVMLGNRDDNTLISRANLSDQLFGGAGSDVFRFQSDYTDGNTDLDTILDYQINQDSVEFATGTAVKFIFEIDNGVMLTLDNGYDSLIIFGDGLTLDRLDAIGHSLPGASGSGGTTNTLPLDTSTFLQGLSFQDDFFNWSIGLPSSSGFDPFPSPNPFIFDPF